MHAGTSLLYICLVYIYAVCVATGADKMYFVILLACSLSLVAAEIGRYIAKHPLITVN